MKKFCVIDCETDPFKEERIPQPFIWGFYNPEEGFYSFTTFAELYEFLKDKNYRVYAHNGGKFDFHYMLDYIENWQKITLINGRLANFRSGGNEYMDSYCILPVSLDTYKKTDINYDIFEKEERIKPQNSTKILNYLKDDCTFLYELIEKFIEENGYSMTIASSAIKNLQKIENYKIENSGNIFFSDIKKYYHGGRVQCFTKGVIKGDIKYYDIISAYPYAMLHDHPEGDFITEYEENPEIIETNFYKIRTLSLGFLPYKDENNMLNFPSDGEIREFHVTGWELITFISFNSDVFIQHIEQKIFIITRNFSKYVNHYYKIKSESAKGTPENIFAKLFLNSAYGKFGANPENYKDTYICDNTDYLEAIEQGYNFHSEIHNRVIISKDSDNNRYYNVATAASITGFVRSFLQKAIKSVENPIYCDTDSLVFTGKNNIITGDKLGEWKKEGEFTEGCVAGKKMYCFYNSETKKSAYASKGVRYDNFEQAYKDIKKICGGETLAKKSKVPIYSFKQGKIYFSDKKIKMT